MQHSLIASSPLTALLGLEPPGVPGGPRPPADGAGEEAFAALLASIDPRAGGDALPAGGNVLPLDAALAALDARVAQGEVVVPAAEAEGVAAEARFGMPRPIAAPPQGSVPLPGSGASPAEPGAVGEEPAQASRLPQDASLPAPLRESPVSHAATLPADGKEALAPASTPTESPGPAPAVPPEQRLEGQPQAASPAAAAAGRPIDPDVPLDGGSAADDALVRTEDFGEPSAPSKLARGVPRASEPPQIEPAVTPAASSGASPAAPAPAVMPVEAAADVHAASARGLQDAPIDARAAPSELGESMAGRIRLLIDQGTGEARLRLNPPELGTIDVRISVVDDKTFVHMTASHSAGRDALEQSLPRLRELLAARGLDVGGASVDGGGRDAEPETGPYRADWPYAFLTEEPAGDAAASSTASRAPAPAAGRIDLFA